jgi:hypothetical protein
METKDKPKRAPRSKKEVTPPTSDSVVSAFGGVVAASTVVDPVAPVAPKGKAGKGKGKVVKAVADVADVADIVTVDAVASPHQSANAKGAKAPTSVVTDTAGAVVAITNPAIFIEEIEPPTPSPAAKSKKTNGSRKPPMIAAVTPDGIKGSLTPITEQRPLIAHLPIHSSDIDNDLFAPTTTQQEPSGNQPAPFDNEEQFANYGQETVKQTKRPVEDDEPIVVTRPSLPLHYSERLMVRFQDANREQRLPESTEVACFWDCHQFKGVPCIIPNMIEEGIWRVYGNFCSPECAAAYLFNERLDLHVRWERFALLNRLYAVDDDSVRLAPARAALRLFGGPMDISDYRSVIAEKRMRLDVMTPPMISIIQVMDTKPIDFYDASMKNTFIPWEMDRMNRPGAQGLRLRRKKPVAEKESTLEFCMGIVA